MKESGIKSVRKPWPKDEIIAFFPINKREGDADDEG